MDRNLPGILRQVVQVDDPLSAGRDLIGVCLAAEQGGATAILLGPAEASGRELAQEARVLLTRLRVPLLLSSRADVAIAVGAVGVHLDADDVPVPLIRRIAPRGFLIGASVGALQEVERRPRRRLLGYRPVEGARGHGVQRYLGATGRRAAVRRQWGFQARPAGRSRRWRSRDRDARGMMR